MNTLSPRTDEQLQIAFRNLIPTIASVIVRTISGATSTERNLINETIYLANADFNRLVNNDELRMELTEVVRVQLLEYWVLGEIDFSTCGDDSTDDNRKSVPMLSITAKVYLRNQRPDDKTLNQPLLRLVK